MGHELVCQSCGATVGPGRHPTGCPECASEGGAGRLEVAYDLDAVPRSAFPTPGAETSTPESMWRYRALLPLLADEPATLSEGGTPVVEATRRSERLGVTVLVKNETTNPTWSFKDRLNSLLLSNAAELGVERVATSSTGNHGASTAAYASLAGVDDVVVLVPPDTEAPLRAQIRAHGAEAVVTEYDARDALLGELVERGWYPTVNVTDPYTGLPYSYEAYRTVAFELVDQLEAVPDAVVTGIGAGDGLYGVWKGFRELAEWGVVDDAPAMVAVQPAERPALVEAVERGADSVGVVEGPMPITTSAGGVSAGDHALRAVRESGGDAYAVERDAIEAAVRETARDGVFLEPASANTLAGVEQAVESGLLDAGDTVVCVGTGAGVKWPEHVARAVGTAPEIEPTVGALAEAVSVDVDADAD
jgi:threonine synthase